MGWEPVSEAEILKSINESLEQMTPVQRKAWEKIKVPPQKWSQEPYGREGGGFWVVAIIGNSVIWYNDIEDGFNCSTFSEQGKINEYYCNQDELEWQVQYLIDQGRIKDS